MMSSLRRLQDFGQSVWPDDLRRGFLDDGSFAALIDNDSVSGLTSNPAIFARAIDESTRYDADIAKYARAGLPAIEALIASGHH